VQIDDDWLAESSATKQYVFDGFKFLNVAVPVLSVDCVLKGVPGRGLALDFGVEISTATLGTGVPRIVTLTLAVVSLGFGVMLPTGVGVGEGVDPLPPHAAKVKVNAMTAKKSEARLGMAGSVRRPYSKYRCDKYRSDFIFSNS
jgi:hypothetical protein